jgi:hypothetical protein
MKDEPVDPEFPEMGDSPVEWETDPNEIVDGDEVFEDEVIAPQEGEMEVQDELHGQDNLDSVELPSDETGFSSASLNYPPREAPKTLNEDSGGTLFAPEDDPLRQPLIANSLDPRLVYTGPVPRRLRHLVCERRGPEYSRPSPELLQPRG